MANAKIKMMFGSFNVSRLIYIMVTLLITEDAAKDNPSVMIMHILINLPQLEDLTLAVPFFRSE